MTRSRVRALIVDDFGEWRQVLRSLLERTHIVQVVGEAADGLDAVQKAQELQPELILLDVGLPKLSGLQALKLIEECAPKARVLFVSENRSWEIAQEAFQIGALGYLVKSDVGRELLAAVSKVLENQQFISSSLVSSWPDSAALGDHSSPDGDEVLSPSQSNAIRHEVAFYEDDAALAHGFAQSATAALRTGHLVVIIATDFHRRLVDRELNNNGVDIEVVTRAGRLIERDSVDVLSKIMIKEVPESIHCAKVLDDLVLEAANRGNPDSGRVAICGECAATLLRCGNEEGAVRLEHLWDGLLSTYSVDTLCGYLWGSFPYRQRTPLFRRICAEHAAIHGSELDHWAGSLS
ncbi:MAG TPA: response regulator [Terriglobales bacterium]|nr:response regulator [Terriglobales bacterium]